MTEQEIRQKVVDTASACRATDTISGKRSGRTGA